VRSLQINYDGRILPLAKLLDVLVAAEAELPPVADMVVPSRLVRLPLAFDADTTRAAIAKYRQSVRDTAPWLPSNVEFIRRINGLPSVEDVERTIYSARYMVLGLGDVYLGAPCAVPVDPRHRMQTTKYNPARTWTAEGEVGIGGVYMCVYGMESPGGYQLVGRTVPVWPGQTQT
jgi:urea carboxylase